MTEKSFKDVWAGRVFRCNSTGEELVIPDSVQERDFYPFGEAFVDVGRLGEYCRMGNCEEVAGGMNNEE